MIVQAIRNDQFISLAEFFSEHPEFIEDIELMNQMKRILHLIYRNRSALDVLATRTGDLYELRIDGCNAMYYIQISLTDDSIILRDIR